MDQLSDNLRAVVGTEAVLTDENELVVYECDGLPQHKYPPRAVVFPSSTEETAEVMRVLAQAGVPLTPRGAGTGLSAGAVALGGGVVLEFARMRRILKVDEKNRLAIVQAGVVNSHVSRAVAQLKLHYVPDPSSQPACTIGGNIAENAGGIHCLKYGTTTDHVMGMRVVLAGGDIVDLGGLTAEQPGYDLRGVFIGSEGTFGIATEATLRLVPIPPSVRTLLAEFAEVEDASRAVSAIIAAGIIPAGLEMMDHEIIKAVEASVFAAGLPPDAGAALIIELDGLEAGIDEDAQRVKNICIEQGARNCRLARDDNERKKLWAARKGAFGAIGRIAPDSMIQDAVVPRSQLPQIMADAYRIASKYQLRIANVFHAGDGNLHPLICFDSRSADQVKRVKEAGRELMETCVRAGGSITGEHGVGLDKRDLLSLIFSADDMDTMLRVRAAFDPSGLLNPGKIIPLLRGCGEARVLSAPQNGDALQPSQQRDVPRPHAQATDARESTRRKEAASFNQDLAYAQLAAIVDHNYVTSLPVGCRIPDVVMVSPASIEETCEILKLASRNGWTIVPAGQASWIDAGNPLRSANVVVSTQRLNRILEHEPADLVAMTEAGVPFDRFNEQVGVKGQWLPQDAPGSNAATIGGLVATGLSGAQRCGYGPIRGYVIGQKVVVADGKLIKAGGRVVKNVAGYDLCKLFTGSYGTLGLIVEVNFKLRPRPETETTVIATGQIQPLISKAELILRAPLFPVGLELLSSRRAQEIAAESDGAPAVLLIRFAGNRMAVREQTRTALSTLEQYISAAQAVEEDSSLWAQLANVTASAQREVSWRAHVPPAHLAALISAAAEAYGHLFEQVSWQSGLADGRMMGRHNEGLESDKIASILRQLRSQCERLGGSLILQEASLDVKQKLDAWGNLGKASMLMQRIKAQLDPQDIFSPGRF